MDPDSLLQELGGCGRFQVILVTLNTIARIPSSFSWLFMTFANYNPGWRCLDNESLANETSWITNECSNFGSCRNVQFNPDSSTVATEWGLICDKAWMLSTIISIQIVGIGLGGQFTGYLEDRFGRKRTFYLDILLTCTLNALAYFSVSWEMYAVIRFFIGLTFSCHLHSPMVVSSEFSSAKWRSVIVSLPASAIGAVLLTLFAMVTRDWRQMQLITAAITFVLFLPTIWTPESIRWLILKNKKAEVVAISNKIARINKTALTEGMDFEALLENVKKTKVSSHDQHSWLQLWKGQVRKYTLITTLPWFGLSLTYYVITFGVSTFSGDFYTNLIVSFAMEIPYFIVTAYVPNLVGRKIALTGHFVFCTIALFAIVGLDRMASADVKGTAILVLALAIKVANNSSFLTLQIYMTELYPTVIRSTSIGYGIFMAQIGGMIAPYFIPKDADDFYVRYLILAGLSLICSISVMFLPETKGSHLKDTLKNSAELSNDVVKD